MAEEFICSKMFTDLNIKFSGEMIQNCCKSVVDPMPLTQIQQLGADVFLHNDQYIARKKSMLIDNRLPSPSCNTCIHTHPHSPFKDWHEWKRPLTVDEKQSLFTRDIITLYELVLSSACDLKCVYCGPKDSSSWAKELDLPMQDCAPEWKSTVITLLLQHLRQKDYVNGQYWFFISGGEPTYNPETLTLISQIAEIVPQEKLIFVLTTNMNTKPNVLARYLQLIDLWPKIRWRFDCSIDALGTQCEAIRYGIDWTRAMSNLTTLLAYPQQRIEIMLCPTVNLLSVPTLLDYLKHFHLLFAKHGRSIKFGHNMVLNHGLSPRNLTTRYRRYIDDAIQYCDEHDIGWSSHLHAVRNLVGTHTSKADLDWILQRLGYFESKRPDINWRQLFPHLDELIAELTDMHLSHDAETKSQGDRA